MKLKTKNGYEFQIDDEDFDKISKYHWIGYQDKRKLKDGTVIVRNNYVYFRLWKDGKQQKPIPMHRLIMDAPDYVEVDHINKNGLDNRKSNLRFCTKAQNGMNRGKNRNNHYVYKGVYWDKSVNRYRAKIKINFRNKYIGVFKTQEEAAIAYNQAAIKYFGEFARLNKVEVQCERI